MKCRIRNIGSGTTIHTFAKWTEMEIELNNHLNVAKDEVHKALCGMHFLFLF